MSWSYLKHSQLEELKDFIELREYSCMNFSTIFRNKFFDEIKEFSQNSTDSNILKEKYSGDREKEKNASDIIIHKNWVNNSIDFSIMFSENGQLLPICRDNITSKIINLNKG